MYDLLELVEKFAPVGLRVPEALKVHEIGGAPGKVRDKRLARLLSSVIWHRVLTCVMARDGRR